MFRKYDPQGTGKLDVHSFVKRLVTPAADNVDWFRHKDTYEFHVLNRAPMKKVSARVYVYVRVRVNSFVCVPRVCAKRVQEVKKPLQAPTFMLAKITLFCFLLASLIVVLLSGPDEGRLLEDDELDVSAVRNNPQGQALGKE